MVFLQQAVSGLNEQQNGSNDPCRATKVTITDVNGVVGHAPTGKRNDDDKDGSSGSNGGDEHSPLLKEIHRVLLDGADAASGG